MASENVERSAIRRPLELECLEERIAPAGSIIATISGGNLTITGDAAGNGFIIDDSGLPANELRITPNPGTLLNGYAGPVVYTGVTGGLKINLGDGDDSMSLYGIVIAKNVQIDAGAGIDTVMVDSFSTIGGSLTLSNADLSQFVDAAVTHNVTIVYTTDGHNTVHMNRGQVGGNFSITHRGQDLFSNFDFNSSTIAGSLTVSNKTGAHGFGDASRLLIHDSLVGGVKVKGGTGDYYFDFINSETVPGKGGMSFSYGVGDVNTLIDNSTVNGSVSLKTAGGLPAIAYDTAFTLRNDSDIHGKLTIRTFDTDDTVVMDKAVVVKGINIDTGTGTSTVTVHSCGIGGERIGTKLLMYPSIISQAASGWSFSDDTTTVSFNEVEMGPLALKLRSQNAHVSFDYYANGGNVSVSTQGGDDVVDFYRCRIAGNIAVKTAGGMDAVFFDSVDARRALSIDTGAGNDSVRIDTGTENLLGEYHGPVKIALGAGDDFLQMGNPIISGNSGLYDKPVALNGGSGTDELYYLNNGNTFTIDPKIDLFENTH